MGKRAGSVWFSLLYNRKRKNNYRQRPHRKVFSENSIKEIMKICNASIGDSVFLACGKDSEIKKFLSIARNKIAEDLKLIDQDKFAFLLDS